MNTVGASKWHNQKLIMSITGSKRRFRHILFSDSQLMVPRPQINLRVEARPLQLVEQIINTRQRISVLNRYLVHLPIIYAHTKAPIFLLNKQNWSSPWRRTGSNETPIQ